MVKKTVAILALALAGFTLTACSSTPASDKTASVQETTGVTAKGVLTAAVVLSSGQVDTALAKGIITPAEVEEARKAIETNTLEKWQQKAEADLKK